VERKANAARRTTVKKARKIGRSVKATARSL
jgi:hypothetical protein